MISICEIHIYIVLKVSDKFIWHLGKIGFWNTAPFVFFLEAKMLNLGPIDIQLGLHLNIDENDGQTIWSRISKNVAKMANFQLKIG